MCYIHYDYLFGLHFQTSLAKHSDWGNTGCLQQALEKVCRTNKLPVSLATVRRLTLYCNENEQYTVIHQQTLYGLSVERRFWKWIIFAFFGSALDMLT